jgi:hypothetical protein
MQPFGDPLNHLEIILDESAFDEGVIVGLNELPKPQREPRCEHLGNELVEGVDERDRPVIVNQRRVCRFGEQEEQGFI